MRTALAIAVAGANSGTAKTCGRSRNYLRTNYHVMQKARVLFPHKTALHIADITGYPLRTVEYWLSKNRLPGEAIGALIQSDYGFEFVAAIADAARPKWWRAVRRALALSDQRNQQAREAQHAATELAAAVARATSANSVFDQRLAWEEDDCAVGAVAGPSVVGRAVATKNKR